MYAPTADSTEEQIETFYCELEEAMKKISKKDAVTLCGDWNAKIGKTRQV